MHLVPVQMGFLKAGAAKSHASGVDSRTTLKGGKGK